VTFEVGCPVKIIPVLDVMNGVVVRAVGGRRAEYKPVVSKLTKSTDPADVLKALIDVTGSDVAYVADLDAIGQSSGPSRAVLSLIDRTDVTLWADFGIRGESELNRIPKQSHLALVLGTETLPSFDVVAAAVRQFNVIGSIDLRNGRPFGVFENFHASDLAAEFAIDGVNQLIILDLVRVGTGHTDCFDLITDVIRVAEPGRVYVGGGIRDRRDVRDYDSLGAAGVLIASALHDGTLP
jgi:phosphoribosylformimino-5-aminoimidazole carboxamide ribotide isomerase